MPLSAEDLKEADVRYSALKKLVSQPVIHGDPTLRGAAGPHFVEENSDYIMTHLQKVVDESEAIIALLTDD